MPAPEATQEEIQIVKDSIDIIPDFPQPGIQYRDITSLLANPEAFHKCMQIFSNRYHSMNVDAIMGIEARGFIFGAVLAHMVRTPFIPIRKHKKLPGDTLTIEYVKEYGKDTVEIQRKALKPGQRVIIVDDLIGTGGSAEAAIKLAQKAGAEVVEVACLIELEELEGRQKLSVPLFSIISE